MLGWSQTNPSVTSKKQVANGAKKINHGPWRSKTGVSVVIQTENIRETNRPWIACLSLRMWSCNQHWFWFSPRMNVGGSTAWFQKKDPIDFEGLQTFRRKFWKLGVSNLVHVHPPTNKTMFTAIIVVLKGTLNCRSNSTFLFWRSGWGWGGGRYRSSLCSAMKGRNGYHIKKRLGMWQKSTWRWKHAGKRKCEYGNMRWKQETLLYNLLISQGPRWLYPKFYLTLDSSCEKVKRSQVDSPWVVYCLVGGGGWYVVCVEPMQHSWKCELYQGKTGKNISISILATRP